MSAVRKSLRTRVRERREAREEIHRSHLKAGAITERTAADFLPVDAKPWRRRKMLLALLLVPVCALASITFAELFFHATVRGAFWRQEGFWFFSCGCLFWLSLGWFGIRPKLPYVFAHEVTHMITAKLSGGQIHDWDVSEDGGYVETDKTSALITLSPYLVPLYTVVVFAIHGIISIFTDLHQLQVWHLSVIVFSFKWAWLFYFLIGATWCFHVTFTLEVLRTEQSDLLHNGEFFSIIIIFLGNLALLGALFISASPTVGWSDVWNDACQMVRAVWRFFF